MTLNLNYFPIAHLPFFIQVFLLEKGRCIFVKDRLKASKDACAHIPETHKYEIRLHGPNVITEEGRQRDAKQEKAPCATAGLTMEGAT